MLTKNWTIEKVKDRLSEFASDHNVSLQFDVSLLNNLGTDTALSNGVASHPAISKEPHEPSGWIYLGNPTTDYTSLEHLVLVALHELSHLIYREMCENARTLGAYADMLSKECKFKEEFWCWNNALDEARMIFGIQLTPEIAETITDHLSSLYNTKDQRIANFQYKGNTHDANH